MNVNTNTPVPVTDPTNSTLSSDQLLKQLQWRYATKQFDASRKIDSRTWNALETSLVLTPSSFGLQPWRFIIVKDAATREKLMAHSWGQRQVVDASHFVVFARQSRLGRTEIDEYVQSIVAARQVPAESLDGLRKMILGFVERPGFSVAEWSTRQVYIALGQFMASAAVLGLDSCPMEGLDPVKYDEILGLEAEGCATAVACAVGYRAATDKYAGFAKVRYPSSKVLLTR